MKEDNKALDIALSAKNRRDAMKAQHQDKNSRTEGRTKTVSQICSYLEKSQMRGGAKRTKVCKRWKWMDLPFTVNIPSSFSSFSVPFPTEGHQGASNFHGVGYSFIMNLRIAHCFHNSTL